MSATNEGQYQKANTAWVFSNADVSVTMTPTSSAAESLLTYSRTMTGQANTLIQARGIYTTAGDAGDFIASKAYVDTAVGGAAAGANTQVQFNTNGAFDASASFTFNDTTATTPVFGLATDATPTTLTTNLGTGSSVTNSNVAIGAGTSTNTAGLIRLADGTGTASIYAEGSGAFSVGSNAGATTMFSTSADLTLQAATSGNVIVDTASNDWTFNGTSLSSAGAGTVDATGGAATLQSTSDGSGVNLSTANATAAGAGEIDLTAGAGAGAAVGGAGGAIDLNTGAGGSNTGGAGGVGGSATIDTGAGGVTSQAAAVAGGAGGSLDLTTGAGGAATDATAVANVGGAGGDFSITMGNGGAASGTGAAVGGAGGSLTIDAGNGGATAGSGSAGAAGTVTITAGDGADSASGSNTAGGTIAMLGGTGGTAQDGGDITLTGGTGGATSGNGGDITITGGTGTGTGVTGVVNLGSGTVGSNANVRVYYNIDQANITQDTQIVNKKYVDTVVNAQAEGPVGSVQLSDGSGDFTNSTIVYTAGSRTLEMGTEALTTIVRAPTATSADTSGARIDLISGSGNGAASGGNTHITAGDSGSGATGAGGDVKLDAGDAVSTNGAGGAIRLTAGNGTGSGVGGDIVMTGGAKGAGAGDAGDISITGGSSIISATGDGGSVTISGGGSTGAGGGDGGDLTLNAGDSTNSNGGDVLINSGDGNTNAGNVVITASTTGTTNGDIRLVSGGVTYTKTGATTTSSGAMNLGSTSADLTLQTTTSGNIVVDSADRTPGASDLTGTNFRVAPQTITAASAENYAFSTFAQPAIGGSTTGEASTVYIAGAPTGTVTSPYALNVAAGTTLLAGTLQVGNGTTSTIESAGSANFVNLFNDDALITLNMAGGMTPGGTLNMATAMTTGTVNIGTGMTSGTINMGSNNTSAEIVYARTDFSAAGSTAMINKGYVDSVASGLTWKDSVRAATTTAGTLASDFENGDTIDGVVLATGDRILIKNQASATENGIYEVQASGAPTRTSDATTSTQATGAAMFVEEGTVNGDKAFVCTTDGPVNFGAATSWSVFTSTGGASGPEGSVQYNSSNNLAGVQSLFFNNSTTTPSFEIGADSGVAATAATLELGTDTSGSAVNATFNLATGTGTADIKSLGTGVFTIAADQSGASLDLDSNTDIDLQVNSTTKVKVTLSKMDVQVGSIDNSTGALSVNSTAGNLSLTTTTSGVVNIDAADQSGTPSETSGSLLQIAAQTFTDGTTAASGTATFQSFTTIAAPTLAATNASVTTTDAATLYIGGPPTAGTNETITNAWAIYADGTGSDVFIGGDLVVNGTLTQTLADNQFFVGNASNKAVASGATLTFDNASNTLAVGGDTNESGIVTIANGTGTSTLNMGGSGGTATINGTDAALTVTTDSGTMTVSSTGDSGDVAVTAGAATTAGVGGTVIVTAGTGNGANAGGGITLNAGAGGATDGDGGSVTLTGGAGGATNSDGGNIVLTPGAGAGTGTQGFVSITSTLAATSNNTGALRCDGGAGFNGKVYADSFHSVSDVRLKENIMPLEDPLNTVRKIESYSYRLKGKLDDGALHYGVLAQQLESIGLNEVVSGEGAARKAVNYTELIPFLIGAIRELSDKVETLESQKQAKGFRFK